MVITTLNRIHRQTPMTAQVFSHTACPWFLASFHSNLFILVALLNRSSGCFPQAADRGVLDNLEKNEAISRQGREQSEGLLDSSQAPLFVVYVYYFDGYVESSFLVVSICSSVCLLDCDRHLLLQIRKAFLFDFIDNGPLNWNIFPCTYYNPSL